MKTTRINLFLVVCLVVAIAALIFTRNELEALRVSGGQLATIMKSPLRDHPSETETRNTQPPNVQINPITWEKLHEGDGDSFVTKLRAAGFPTPMIRAMVSAYVRESFLPKYRATLPPETAKWDYWKPGASRYDSKLYSAVRTLGREESDTVKRLLGADYLPAENPADVLDVRRYGPISAEKIDQIKRINEDYAELLYETREGMRGFKLPGDGEKIAFLEAERRADLSKLLTSEELEAYNLRSTSTASQLRSMLVGFDPSEGEFRAIYVKQREYNDKYNEQSIGMSIGNAADKSRDEKVMKEEIKAALGAERYKAYEQATDPFFQAANRAALRLQLPATAAADVWAAQKEYVNAYNGLLANKSLSSAQRLSEATNLYDRANSTITGILGNTGTEAYRAAVSGWLSPPRQTAPKK